MAAVVLHPNALQIDPGSAGAVTITVRNTSPVVEAYELSVLGDAAAWATVTPASLSLFPGADGVATVVFSPPRTAAVAAGPVDFAVRVAGTQDPTDSTVEEGTITVGPFVALTAVLSPRTVEAKRTAKATVSITNNGNAPATVRLTATDPDEALAFEASEELITINAGEQRVAALKVAARSGHGRGPARHLPYQAIVTAEQDHAPVVLDGSMSQRSSFPKFVPPLIAAAVILVAAAVIVPGLTSDEDGGGTFTLTGAANDVTTTVPAAEAPVDEGAVDGGEAAVSDDPAAPGAEVAQAEGGAKPASAAAPQAASGGAAPAAAPSSSGGQPATSGGGQATPSDSAAQAAKPVANPTALPRPSDGKPIVWASTEGPDDEEIWKINPDGSEKWKLTNFSGGWCVQPTTNFAGTQVAFARHGGNDDIYLVNVSPTVNGGLRPLVATPSSEHSPAWSPDDRTIVYVRDNDLWTVDIASGSTKALVTSNLTEVHPRYSPDGKSVVFQRVMSGSDSDLIVLDLASGKETRLNTGGNDQYPAWSPDGTKIAFQSGRSNYNHWEIWYYDVAAGSETRVTNNSVADEWPGFSPDSSKLIFWTARFGGSGNAAMEIHTTDLRGGDVRRYTANSAWDRWAYWA